MVKGCHVGQSLRSVYHELGLQMKIEIQSDSSTANSLTEHDSERNTLTRGTSGCQNESKTGTSVSRRCLWRRTAEMLERCQSLLQYCNNIASLQDSYSTDHGSHTPLQDEGDEPMMDLVTGLQTRCENRESGRKIKHTETDSCQR